MAATWMSYCRHCAKPLSMVRTQMDMPRRLISAEGMGLTMAASFRKSNYLGLRALGLSREQVRTQSRKSLTARPAAGLLGRPRRRKMQFAGRLPLSLAGSVSKQCLELLKIRDLSLTMIFVPQYYF